MWLISFFVFFFQAEDGIRDLTVTGVQTCALPISPAVQAAANAAAPVTRARLAVGALNLEAAEEGTWGNDLRARVDRKSTRLNSSHSQISYAVFCLKKKKKKTNKKQEKNDKKRSKK